jgi:hypothetical protein
MSKQATIQIHDSKGGKFRVKSVGKNGEILQVSEPLESVAAVKKHLCAMYELWATSNVPSINVFVYWLRSFTIDKTKGQKFAKLLK